MKSAIMVGLAILMTPLYGVNNDLMLEAIRLKENSTTTGKAGELGPWRMMPKAVLDNGGFNKNAASRHLLWLKMRLQERKAEPNCFNLALCWNAGLQRAISGKAKESSYLYAADVEKIYKSLKP